MKYFKNTELARLYHVSEKSVRNWIQATREGRLNLRLYDDANGKSYVANTSQNNVLIEELVQKGKKYKNSRGFKVIKPKKRFYETYNQKQILDIIANLTKHHEIPREYCYFAEGARAWDEFTNRLDSEQTPNIVNGTKFLLELTEGYIDRLLGDRRVNIVDIVPGNGVPIRPTLERLVKQNRLNKYIAIDMSQDMLDILERNIREWFGDKVTFEGCVRDISHERFDDLFANDYAGDDAHVPTNLVLFLGGSLSNFRMPRQVLHSINSSLSLNDILVFSCYLDTLQTRRYFDFTTPSHDTKLPLKNGVVVNLLGIDESLYDVEQIFSEQHRARSISIEPKVDLVIAFEFAGGVRHVELLKGEPILLWRHHHYAAVDIIDLFSESNFELFQAVKADNQDYLLHISKIKRDGV